MSPDLSEKQQQKVLGKIFRQNTLENSGENYSVKMIESFHENDLAKSPDMAKSKFSVKIELKSAAFELENDRIIS